MIRALLAVAVALALADASIVTLGLPPILDELDASVNGAAAVLGVYTLVLALALIPAEALRRRAGTRAVGATGLVIFALAGAAAGAADSLGVLVTARAVQAAGAAAGLVCAFAVIGGGRLWAAAAVFGTAVGPALGGLLTEALDWRAIFYVQAPIGLLAAAAVAARPAPGDLGAAAPALRAWPRGALLALALVSAALTGVLFLLVLLLVSGWSVSPLAAAAAVTILPLAAVAGSRIPGSPRGRAAAGAVLLGAGVAALAYLPRAGVGWTVAPQVLAGLGMGMALPALAGELLPERTPGDAAWLLAVRHLGITVVLAVLAPIASERLDRAVEQSREQGAALVLDARLPPLDKLELAGALVADLDPVDPRAGLDRSLAANAGPFQDDPEERAAYAQLRERADDVLVGGVTGAFSLAFLVCGALALLAAPAAGRPKWALAALALPLAMALAKPALEPDPVVIADPCQTRELPRTGGFEGFLQDAALVSLDRAACRFGTSREELALAIADEDLGRAYRREHGVDPRDVGGLLEGAIGLP